MTLLPDPEIFIGMSALGLTVTGFSGLIAVLGRRAAGNWSLADRLQLEQLLEVSLAVTFASLIPILVSAAAESQSALGVATGLVALFHLVIMARGFVKLRTRGRPSFDLPGSVVLIFFVGGSLLILGALASSFVYLKWAALFLLSNIVWLLVIAITHFVVLLMNPVGSNDA